MATTTASENLSHNLFERSDDFGPYLSATDLGDFDPKLEDMPTKFTNEVREAMLAAALANAPEAEVPVEMSYEEADRAQAMYSSADLKFKEGQEARKVAARWVLSQEPEGPVTDKERLDYKTSDLLLVHAHRTRKRFKNVSMAVLAGWAYDETKDGDITAIHVKKDIAAAIKASEDKRKAEAAS